MSWSDFSRLWLPPRSLQQEWLDAEDLPAQDVQGNLDDLRRLNRCLGSHWLLRMTLQRIWRQAGCPRHFRVLDVGTGAGDIPEVLIQWAQRHGVHLVVMAIDNHAGVLQYRRASQPLPAAITFVLADGLCLPFRPRTFDVVMCSTMLHHLAWQQGITLMRSMATVARYGVVVNDLVRSRLHYYAARLVLAVLARHQVTRHDGALSVLRAYSVGEVREMARLAGCTPVQVSLRLGYRFVLAYMLPITDHETSDGA